MIDDQRFVERGVERDGFGEQRDRLLRMPQLDLGDSRDEIASPVGGRLDVAANGGDDRIGWIELKREGGDE
ncbi:hypothetical protein ACX0GZ_07730 [Sphingomonas aestuarii]